MELNEILSTYVVPIVLALITGGGAGLFAYRATIRKLDADSQNVVIGSTISVVEMLRAELEIERKERQRISKELREELANERAARRADADNCKAEIGLRDTEIAILKRALNEINRKLEKQGEALEKIKVDTDDLAKRTPPPLIIPGDPTPPIPTRSTFQDEPSDQPPDDAA